MIEPCVVVLAAGSSERMGQPKQLLKLGGRPFIERVVAAAGSRDVVVVVAPGEAEVRTAAGENTRLTFVENPDPDRGSWSSLLTAIDALPRSRPIVVLLVDMPEVDRHIVDRLVEQATDRRAWAAVCVYVAGVRKHPVYLSAAAQDAARQRNVPNRLWSLLVDDPPQPVLPVTIDRPAPIDVDTPEDYVELLRRTGTHPEPPG